MVSPTPWSLQVACHHNDTQTNQPTNGRVVPHLSLVLLYPIMLIRPDNFFYISKCMEHMQSQRFILRQSQCFIFFSRIQLICNAYTLEVTAGQGWPSCIRPKRGLHVWNPLLAADWRGSSLLPSPSLTCSRQFLSVLPVQVGIPTRA